jgi:hypothetical protein
LGSAANRADPVRRQLVKRGVGGDVIVWVTLGRIINVTANITLIFLHNFLLVSMVLAAGQTLNQVGTGGERVQIVVRG